MENISQFNLNEAVINWHQQFKTITSFTETDVQQFKYDLLDSVDALKLKGLDEEEAFIVSSYRYQKVIQFHEEIGSENSERILLRRITQVFSGVLTYFFFYFMMHLSSKIVYLKFLKYLIIRTDYVQYIYWYFVLFHFLLIVLTICLYFFGKDIARKFEIFTLKPVVAVGFLLMIVSFAFLDHWLMDVIRVSEHWGITSRFYLCTGHCYFTFPTTFICCFIILYRKFYIYAFSKSIYRPSSQNFENYLHNKTLGNLKEEQISIYKKIGLEEEEIKLIEMKRMGLKIPPFLNKSADETAKASWRALLIILSGVLFYSLAFFFLNSTSRILIIVLQILRKDPDFTTKWTWFYSISCHLVILFFAISVYIRDVSLMNKLSMIKNEKKYVTRLFVLTLIFAVLFRFFSVYSRIVMHHERSVIAQVEHVFVICQYTFPLTFAVCFLILFFKYYYENIKIKLVQ